MSEIVGPACAPAVPADDDGLAALAQLALAALADGRRRRTGALAAGGPIAVADRLAAACGPVLPEHGAGPAALAQVVSALAEGAADPIHPWCSGHLHCRPLDVAVAADLAATALNPSLDSWDQAPAASVLEAQLLSAIATLVFPAAPNADALPASGGTESNLLALLLTRERAGADGGVLRVITGAAAHHSVARSAWVLGLPPPIVVAGRRGVLDPAGLDVALCRVCGPTLVVATAGTTDTGAIDPLGPLGELARHHRSAFHVDAAYGGLLVLSDSLRARLAGIEQADTVALDLHKLGWQPVGAGVLALREARWAEPLAHRADYLNAADDVASGQPDLLGRSLRTSRAADLFGAAVTFRALGRAGLAAMVEGCVTRAAALERRVARHCGLRSHGPPALSTVLFRPVVADRLAEACGREAGDHVVGEVRRRLLWRGTAVLGRAEVSGDDGTPCRWLKLTVLSPTTEIGGDSLDGLLDEVVVVADQVAGVASGRSQARP